MQSQNIVLPDKNMKDEWNKIYAESFEINKYPPEILVSWVNRNNIKKSSIFFDIVCGFFTADRAIETSLGHK